MSTNDVFKIIRRQKIGHCNFLKYPFSYDYSLIKLPGKKEESQNVLFMAHLRWWQIYPRTCIINKECISFA